MKASELIVVMLIVGGVFLGTTLFYSDMAQNYGVTEITQNKVINDTLQSLSTTVGSQAERMNSSEKTASPGMIESGVTFLTSGFKAAAVILNLPGIALNLVLFVMAGLHLPGWVEGIMSTAVWLVVIVTLVRIFTKGEM